ncbi:MAG: tRNA pseudouridine(55) synthase TruB [Chloroflexota bacterium]
MGYSGILNLDKPTGLTSHDVVDAVRRYAGQRRVGHAGTLDPGASGVLLVCLGQATRVSEFLMESTKQYRAVIRFGAVSTTDDADGVITPGSASLASLSQAVFSEALSRFVGEVSQVPPAFSAIKIQGRPMYRAARAGQPVSAPARAVIIDQIDLIAWECPDLTVDVTCSKGTYIRALARDLGEAVGTGAYLQSLIRLRSGAFSLQDSISLDRVREASQQGQLGRLLKPLDVAVQSWPAVSLAPDEVRAIRQGKGWNGPAGTISERARAHDAATGRLVALLRFEGAEAGWRPDKVFSEDGDDVD